QQIAQAAAAIKRARRPLIYAGGGIISSDASPELHEFVRKTGIPVTTTLMGIGSYPTTEALSMGMLGMHGTVYANYAINNADLVLAFGVRFDDRVTGKLSEFLKNAKIVHIDIDPSELNKNKEAHIPICSDVKYALGELNKVVQAPEDIGAWVRQCAEWKDSEPLYYDEEFDGGILQQYAVEQLSREVLHLDPIVTVGVGQHQMWAAQFFDFRKPRTWVSSSGLGTMGFGLPAAMGAKVAHPDKLVIDIDGDGSFQMNIQELGTTFCEKLPVKILLLNNMHLGMVMQWEDRFYDKTRAHTYLGPIDHPEAQGQGDGIMVHTRYPDFVAIAKGYGCGGATVEKKSDYIDAIREMIEYPGTFLLDVKCPYQEHVLPMIPSGQTVHDMIKLPSRPRVRS
ncbi:MAG TPA: thiamine pyrophosphate-dependent enzyme, partial [Pirellulales bacterium]